MEDAVEPTTPTKGADEGTEEVGNSSGIKRFIAKRRESFVNGLHRRNSSSGSPVGSAGSSPTSYAPSPLFGRKVGALAVDAGAGPEDEAKAVVLKKGDLSYLEKKKAKTQGFVLSSLSLRSVDGSARVLLRDITALMVGGTDFAFCFSLVTGMQKTVVMGCDSEDEFREWVLVLNAAACVYADSLGILSYTTKVKLLGEIATKFSGGIAKREEIEEEWQYRKSGILVLQNKEKEIKYQWDGMSLLPVGKHDCGKGSFDGMLLQWFAPKGVLMGFERKKKKKRQSVKKKGTLKSEKSGANVAEEESSKAPEEKKEFEENAAFTFLYCVADKAYYWFEENKVHQEDSRSWKWSRHFLTKIQGTGHWLAEGSVPDHAIFFLQMMRYFRVGFPSASAPSLETAAAVKEEEKE